MSTVVYHSSMDHWYILALKKEVKKVDKERETVMEGEVSEFCVL
jgi:hypothetical protein